MKLFVETWGWSQSWECLVPYCYALTVASSATAAEDTVLAVENFKSDFYGYLEKLSTHVEKTGLDYDVFREFSLKPYQFKFSEASSTTDEV